ncbi:MAG TPA: alpha/beta hydrolase [Kutzneria sp.]|jgi:pimeloyl-ACP methyl ester carboxylesterase|nr:alpha/beta hydrolase [Kutzneria sp.]
MTSPADFEHRFADVNGTRLHHVVAGAGEPLILMGGWPRTWWQFHRVIPLLAKHYRVIAVDIRGMGDSARPADGYDKKTMARDIHELINRLGFERAHVYGDDIGGMVAFSLAWNHPESVDGLVIADGIHPTEALHEFPMVPRPGQLVYPWWWVTGLLDGLVESWQADKFRAIIDWNIEHIGGDPSVFDEQSRDIYAAAYNTPEAIRATNGWFRTFGQDIADFAAYPKLEKPLLYIGGSLLAVSKPVVEAFSTTVAFVEFPGAGHFLAEQHPERFADVLTRHLG